MIQAVIFDMDGVVTDSESLGLEALMAAGRAQGVEMTEAFLKSTMGMTFQSSREMYREHYPTLDAERAVAFFMDYMYEKARAGQLPLMPGVREFLDFLDQKGIKRALASSSRAETVRVYLESSGVYDRFDRVISGDMCQHSKPAPDIFLMAAEALGVAPENCLVLEDSMNGVRAGRAAGMQVCMIPDQLPYTQAFAPYCDHVVKQMLDVKELLS